MELLELRNRLRKSIGSPPEDQVSNADLDGYINLAYVDVATRYPNFNERTDTPMLMIDGTDSYNISTSTGAIVGIKLDLTGKPLKRLWPRDFARWVNTPPGKPRAWARDGGLLRIFPVPDGNYLITIRHKAAPLPLQLNTDIPVLPSDWHYGILLRARWYYWDSSANDFPKASAALQSFNVWIADKPSDVEEEKGFADSAVELPELEHGYGSRFRIHGRYDDGTFDYRE